MSGKDKINIFPSRGAQTTMKGRLKAAQKGHSLLKKKADALQLRFRMILKKIVETKQTMGEVMKEAAFSLAEAKFARGEFNQVLRLIIRYILSDDVSIFNLISSTHPSEHHNIFSLSFLACIAKRQ